MIRTLRQGMHVMLPSGNVVALVRRERAFWVCEYTTWSTSRGAVEFTGVWLRRHGVEA